jgi:hypothetical protein
MSEIGALPPESLRMLWMDYLERKQQAPQIQQNFPQRRIVDEPSPHRVFIRNDSGETMPAFGCGQVTGTADVGGVTCVTIEKPADACGEYVFNSEFEIADGANGWAYRFGIVPMLGTGTLSQCGRYAPVADSWSIANGPGPFVVYGQYDTGIAYGRIVGDKCKAKWIKFRYTPGGGSITVDEFFDGPDPTDCGSVTVEYPLGEPCVASDVLAFHDPNTDTYQAIASESAMIGPAETLNIITAMAFDGCGINYVRQAAKVFPCGSEPAMLDTSPTLVPVNVLTSAGIQNTVTDCEATCEYTWNAGTEEWELTTPCSGPAVDCDCGAAPEIPPGEWNDNATTFSADCTSTAATGLAFAAATVYVCSTEAASSTVIPLTEECPEEPA